MDYANRSKLGATSAPMWVVTFADLMALLLCFFVLLLAFSEMDAQKFKLLMGSMKNAFGVQREVAVKEIPKGTNVVMREFSPGRPKPTPIREIRQATVKDFRRHAEVGKSDGDRFDRDSRDQKPSDHTKTESVRVERLKAALKQDVDKGLLEVQSDSHRIVVRIKEKSSFPSGSAALMPKFEPVISRIAEALHATAGLIIVAGHTDNVPISNARFRSNWELSAARAVSVVHSLRKRAELAATRFTIEGHADTVPLADNDTPTNRARNRRVEIVILKSGVEEDRGILDLSKKAVTGYSARAAPAKHGGV